MSAPVRPVVTFDVFSALLDSRQGGARVFDAWSRERHWPVPGAEVYDRWDALNKRSHRDVTAWLPYAELAGVALEMAYRQLDLPGDPKADSTALLDSMADWPMWPDVEDGLGELAGRFRLGVLSNIDDDLLARTHVRTLPVATEAIVTSERVGAYKPSQTFYAEAERLLSSYVHVASSARDVRGALEAGVRVVRLRRPGHGVDPDGPRPPHQATSTVGLAATLLAAIGA